MVNDPESNMLLTGIPDESIIVPVFKRRSFVDDNCFCGRFFNDRLTTLNQLLERSFEFRMSVGLTNIIFVQPHVDFLSHKINA